MKEEDIKYKSIDGDSYDNEIMRESIDLLHDYLGEFISREALENDVGYCFREGKAIAAYHEEELIGVVVGVYTPFFDKFHIGHIAVKENFQGKGIGCELTDRVIPEDVGASVHLNMGNPGVEEFYEKMGFQQTHKRFKKPSKKDNDLKPSD